MAFHPKDRVVASCSEDNSIKLWKLDDGGLISTMKVDDSVLSVAYSPDGTKLTAGLAYPSNSVVVFDTQTNEQICSLKVDAGEYGVQSVSFSPKGDMVAAGCYNGNIFFVDAAAGQIKSSVTGHRYVLFPIFSSIFRPV